MPSPKSHHATTTITPADLASVPMGPHHKALIKRHYARLYHIIHATDELAIGRYTNKQAAREQLARMTLVIRDYISLAKQRPQTPEGEGGGEEKDEGEEDDATFESMVMDVIDASLSSCVSCGDGFGGPMFVNPQLWGREQEIAMIMQEQSAGGGGSSEEDVLELWNSLPVKEKRKDGAVLPDCSNAVDIGKDVDWSWVVRRRGSEGDLTRDKKAGWGVGVGDAHGDDEKEGKRYLVEREIDQLDLTWPPVV